LIWIRRHGTPRGTMHSQVSLAPEVDMKLFQDLFFTDYGLMSFLGIVFMIGMAIFFVRLFTRKP
jgi:hypothetical protein